MDLFSHALGTDTTFNFCREGEHPVLYKVKRVHDQLVLPSGGGFHDTVLQKLYNADLRGHLGSARTLEALQACIWLPHIYADMEAYVAV